MFKYKLCCNFFTNYSNKIKFKIVDIRQSNCKSKNVYFLYLLLNPVMIGVISRYKIKIISTLVFNIKLRTSLLCRCTELQCTLMQTHVNWNHSWITVSCLVGDIVSWTDPIIMAILTCYLTIFTPHFYTNISNHMEAHAYILLKKLWWTQIG